MSDLDFVYLGDQMTVEEMERRLKDFSEDDWDSYNTFKGLTPENAQKIRNLFQTLGRPQWFVAWNEGIDVSYQVKDGISLELSMSCDGVVDGICVEYRNTDDNTRDWYRYIGERNAWETYGTENKSTKDI